MPANPSTSDRRRKLRAEFLEILIGRGDSSIQSAMLATEAIVNYVESGSIPGIDNQAHISDAGESSKRRQPGGTPRTR